MTPSKAPLRRSITRHTINADAGFLAAGLMFPFALIRHRPLATKPND